MNEIDPHFGVFREEAMLAHFWPLVVREGATELGGQRSQFTCKGLPHGGGILGLQRDQHDKPGGPLHQRAERRGIGMAHEQVSLPMPWHRAVRQPLSAARQC